MDTKPATITPKLPKLKPKQLKFVMLYLKDGNATQAYKDAGYSANGAEASSSRMLGTTVIRSYIDRLQDAAQVEHKDILSTLMKRTNAATIQAEKDKDSANTFKGLDQLAKLGHMYDKANAPGEDRPAFVGINIHMGNKPSVEIVRVPETKEKVPPEDSRSSNSVIPSGQID